MRSRRSSKKELAEALAAIAVILSFEFAAPAIALAVGTMGIGDIIAAATFAAGFGAGVAFYTYVGGCGYTFVTSGIQIWQQGWAGFGPRFTMNNFGYVLLLLQAFSNTW
jgi:hypothetical protein